MAAERPIHEDIKQLVLLDLPGTFYRRDNDSNQIILKTSENWEELTGFSILETAGKISFVDLIFPEDKEYVFETIKKCIEEQKKWKIAYRIVTKYGVFKWVEEKGAAILGENNQLLFLEGYINKIYKNNDENFKNYSYQKAVNSSAIVSITDLKGKILFVNDLFCHYSGYSKSELIGQNHRIINSSFHSKSYFKELWDTILSGKIWRGEIRNLSKEGHFYWVDTVITPVFNQQGEIEQFLSIRNIISDKKNTENIVKTIYKGLTIKSDEHFFKNLTKFCCNELEVEYAFIGWFNNSSQTIETISFNKNGTPTENFIYSLENTPCSDVINSRSCSFPNNVQKHFPKDHDLIDLGVESYLGIPIIDDKKTTIGLIVLMDTKPMRDSFEKEFVLNFVTPRIVNEVKSWVTQNKIKENESFNVDLLSSIYSQIAIIDESGVILYMNQEWSDYILNNKFDIRFEGIGANYIENLIDTIKNTDNPIALKIYNAIESIFDKVMDNFQILYTSPTNGKTFLMNISYLKNSTNKLVLSQMEIQSSN